MFLCKISERKDEAFCKTHQCELGYEQLSLSPVFLLRRLGVGPSGLFVNVFPAAAQIVVHLDDKWFVVIGKTHPLTTRGL